MGGEASGGGRVIIGTRGSQLAMWQANRVHEKLEQVGVSCQIEEITTTGDRLLQETPSEIDEKGLFTKELDRAIVDGRIDCAVHSLKDLQTRLPDGLALAAISERHTPWDVLVGADHWEGGIQDLPQDAVLATSSLRRKAQIKYWRSDIEVVPVRGNVDTRLEKLADSDWEGLILAEAGLVRLDRSDAIRERFTPAVMLPAVGQGALGIVTRSEDEDMHRLLNAHLHHHPSAVAATAERAMLRRLEGGCKVPVGAWGRLDDAGTLHLDGCVAAVDGSTSIRYRLAGQPDDAESMGVHLAEYLLHHGADEILREIRGEPIS